MGKDFFEGDQLKKIYRTTIPEAVQYGYFVGLIPIPLGKRNFYFTSPGTETSGAENGSSNLSLGEVKRESWGRAIGKLFRLKPDIPEMEF